MHIYLDYNATTPVDPVVLEAMLPYFSRQFGNSNSRTHSFGRDAAEAVAHAREQVASLIAAEAREISFYTSATEAIKKALVGLYESNKGKSRHIISAQTEHKAVLNTLEYLESTGASVTYLPVNEYGHIDLQALESSIRPDTFLLCLMYANNETGTISDIQEIGAIARKHQITFMSDATQAIGKIPVDVSSVPVDVLCFSGHKLYGPKGAGTLYIRKKTPALELSPIAFTSKSNKEIELGTPNVPAIVGMGAACAVAQKNLAKENTRLASLRNLLESLLKENCEIQVNGDPQHRLPNTSNVGFKGIEANMLLEAISREIAAATGSACTSASPGPSHVLKAMQLSPERIHGSVRFSIGRFTTEGEIQQAVKKISEVIQKLR